MSSVNLSCYYWRLVLIEAVREVELVVVDMEVAVLEFVVDKKAGGNWY